MSGAVYDLSNVLGTPYAGGNLAFTPNGQVLAMAAGNRLQLIELISGNTLTMAAEAYAQIHHILIDPKNANYAIVIDVNGKSVIVNLVSQTKIGEFKFRDTVTCAAFSPCGNYLAIGLPKNVEIYNVPCPETHWAPKMLTRTIGDNEKLETLTWCPDGQWIVTGGRDGVMRLIPCGQESLAKLAQDDTNWMEDDDHKQYQYLSHHHTRQFLDQGQRIRGVFVSADGRIVRSVGTSGKICSYIWSPQANKVTDVSRATSANKLTKSIKKQKTNIKLEPETVDDSVLIKEEVDADATKAYPDYTKGSWTKCGDTVYASGKGHVTGSFQVSYRGTTAGYIKAKHQMWIIGFSGGSCTAYDSATIDLLTPEPPLDALFELKVSEDSIDTISMSHDGERVAMASKASGEMVIWEWRSETFVYKHSGHTAPIRAVAFSPSTTSEAGSKKETTSRTDVKSNSRSAMGIASRSLAATGDEHGIIKLWDTELGHCIHTITDHTAAVTDIAFTPQGNAFFTSSLDGSIRGYDLARLRNFRTLVDPEFGSQFTSLAIDSTGEIIVASTQEGGAGDALLVWDIKTGSMIDRLNGHEGTISQVAYDPNAGNGGQIATASYDKTVRVWDIYGRAGKSDKATILLHTSEVMALAYDPRSNGLLATSSLGGLIEFWDVEEGESVGSIKADRDLYTGRKEGSTKAATSGTGGRSKKGGSAPTDAYWSSICYTPDGLSLICGSEDSARICIYSTVTRNMINGFFVTRNLSLDGIFRELRSSHMTTHGYNKSQLNLSDDDDFQDSEWQKAHASERKALPGIQTGALAQARNARKLKIFQLDVSSDARSIAVATSHGMFVYGAFNSQSAIFTKAMTMSNQSLANEHFGINLAYDPDASIDGVYELLKQGHTLKALRWALQLGDMKAIGTVYLSIPEASVALSVAALNLPENMALINFLRLLLLPNGKQIVPLSAKDTIMTVDGQRRIGGSHSPVPHLHLHMSWLNAIMTSNLGTFLIGNASTPDDKTDHRTLLLLLLRSVQSIHSYLSKLYMPNVYELKHVIRSNKQTEE